MASPSESSVSALMVGKGCDILVRVEMVSRLAGSPFRKVIVTGCERKFVSIKLGNDDIAGTANIPKCRRRPPM